MKRGGGPAGRLPVARFLLTLPAAALAFIAIAILDQRETFLSAWGITPPAPAVAKSTPGSEQALAAIGAFNRAMERAYRLGSAQALAEVSLGGELRSRLTEEFSYLPALARASGMELSDFKVISVEPSGAGGWRVTTDETWAAANATRRNRLRFRYVLLAAGGAPRIDDITPILPEPVRAPRD
jgi:hypothetical protein